MRQTLCHPQFRGRMQALSPTVTAGSHPLAVAIAGVLVAHLLDVRTALAFGALRQVTPSLLLLLSPPETSAA